MSAHNFPRLHLKKFAAVQERESSESKYWRSFSVTKEEKLQSAPNCIHFCPALPQYYLVTGSTRVSLYDSNTDAVQRSFSRFTDDAFSGKFRKDGKLLCAGDKAGYVKVFDVTTKAVLRQFKQHTAAVRSTTWTSDGLCVLSGSDDKSVKRWDLATGDVAWDSKKAAATAHTDYVRCVDANPSSADLFVSGSYDHSVRLWDSRQQEAVQVMVHGSPLEHCLVAPSGTMLFTAGSNEIKVWDLLRGGKLMHTFCNHTKSITCLAMDGTGSRLLSSSLDGHVKVYSLQTMQVSHGMKFGSPSVSVGVSPDNKKLVVGFVDGHLMIRTRKNDLAGGGGGSSSSSSSSSSGSSSSGSGSGGMEVDGGVSTHQQHARFYKGAGAAAEREEDGMIETERSARLRPYEKHLQKFNYQKALDAALITRNPLVIVTVLEELSRRSGLKIALAGRDESTLEPLISFAARYVSNPRYARLIIQVVEIILDLYGSVLGHSEAIDELFLKLHKQVKSELEFQRQTMTVIGQLDGIVNASQSRPV